MPAAVGRRLSTSTARVLTFLLLARMLERSNTKGHAVAKWLMRRHVVTLAAITASLFVNSAAWPDEPAAKKSVELKVKSVVRVKTKTSDKDPVDRAGLGDLIDVEIENLTAWTAVGKPNDSAKLVLFLNGMALKGLYTDGTMGKDTLRFYLRRTAESEPAWTALLRRPQFEPRPVSVSIGPEAGPPVPSDAADFKLIVIRTFWFAMYFVSLAVVLILLVWLAAKSNLLRESSDPSAPGNRRPFSLGRTQMAFWFFLILAAYLAIWMITWNYETLTAGMLGLMGISAGTALGAEVVDSGKRTQRVAQKAELDALNALATPDMHQQARLHELTRLTQAPTAAGSCWFVFLDDLLTDDEGITLHRFQIVVWTIALGVIFCHTVFYKLAMPEFGATELSLMGISAGTYLGFKLPEKKSS